MTEQQQEKMTSVREEYRKKSEALRGELRGGGGNFREVFQKMREMQQESSKAVLARPVRTFSRSFRKLSRVRPIWSRHSSVTIATSSSPAIATSPVASWPYSRLPDDHLPLRTRPRRHAVSRDRSRAPPGDPPRRYLSPDRIPTPPASEAIPCTRRAPDEPPGRAPGIRAG